MDFLKSRLFVTAAGAAAVAMMSTWLLFGFGHACWAVLISAVTSALPVAVTKLLGPAK